MKRPMPSLLLAIFLSCFPLTGSAQNVPNEPTLTAEQITDWIGLLKGKDEVSVRDAAQHALSNIQ